MLTTTTKKLHTLFALCISLTCIMCVNYNQVSFCVCKKDTLYNIYLQNNNIYIYIHIYIIIYIILLYIGLTNITISVSHVCHGINTANCCGIWSALFATHTDTCTLHEPSLSWLNNNINNNNSNNKVYLYCACPYISTFAQGTLQNNWDKTLKYIWYIGYKYNYNYKEVKTHTIVQKESK